MPVQRLAIEQQRADDGNLLGHQFGRESVFLADLGIAPAPGAVELGDDGRAVFQMQLVDPVFIAGQRQHAPIAEQADGGQRVHHHVGC